MVEFVGLDGWGWVERGSGLELSSSFFLRFATGKTFYHPVQTARKIKLGTAIPPTD